VTAYLDPSELAARGRFSKLAWIGARRAAAAFASLLGREMRAGEPRPRAAAHAAEKNDAETAVIFEMHDTVQGLLALLFPRDVCESVISTLCPETDVSSPAGESALREVGNIVASQAVSAVADHLGGRITLSVPILVGEGGGLLFSQLLAERREGRASLVTEIELCEAGERRGLLLFAPDARQPRRSDTVTE
jgi:chemotaxis protein CheY-P-specific phosphatase CheC